MYIRGVQVKPRHMWQYKLENCPGVCLCSTITNAHMLPTQQGTPCAVLAGVFWISPWQPRSLSVWLSHVWALEEDSEGQRFNFDEVVREAVEQWFIQQPVSFFAEDTTKLVQHWDKCLNSGGQYLYLSRTAIRVLSLWCSGCCQIHIVYVSGPLSMFHLNNPYRWIYFTKAGIAKSVYRLDKGGKAGLRYPGSSCEA
jgi:hypothetical protein